MPADGSLPAGKFLMGSPARSGRFDSEGPQHVVTLKAFALGKFDVTSEEFLTFLRATGYQPAPCNPLLGFGLEIIAAIAASPPRRAAALAGGLPGLEGCRAFLAWLNAQVSPAHPEPAPRGGPIACPAKRNGNMPPAPAPTPRAGGARRSAAAMPTAMAAAANGTTICWPTWTASAPIPSALRHAGQCLGMDGGLLASQLCRRARRWQRLDREICTACHSRRRLEQCADLRALRRAQRRGADGGDYDYSTLAGFRVARDLP